MKKTKNYLLSILSLIFFIMVLSCSTDEVENNQQPNELKLIKVTELTRLAGELTEFGPEGSVTYEYGSNGYIKKLIGSGGFIRIFNYNVNNQIESIEYINNSGVSYVESFVYNNEGLIISHIYDNTIYGNFTYNNEGQVLTFVGSSSPNEPATFIYDSEENLVNIIHNSEIIETYEYDTKINPFSRLTPEAYNKIMRIGNHNMIYRENCNRIITYEYNDQNLPISSQYNDCGGYVQNREYFYSN